MVTWHDPIESTSGLAVDRLGHCRGNAHHYRTFKDTHTDRLELSGHGRKMSVAGAGCCRRRDCDEHMKT